MCSFTKLIDANDDDVDLFWNQNGFIVVLVVSLDTWSDGFMYNLKRLN